MKNTDRAIAARQALATFVRSNGLQDEDTQTQITDLLTNIYHLCDLCDVDRGTVVDLAAVHYHAERIEEQT